MGSISLECPLCCDEKFSTHDSLKYHLLSILDNLSCPGCSEKFHKIIDLAEHLGTGCNKTPDTNIKAANLNTIKIEIQDNDGEDINDSILAKALLRRPEEITDDQGRSTEDTIVTEVDVEEVEMDSEEDLFYCSSCTIHFTSVEQHLQEFHVGHEVLIQDGDEVVSKEILGFEERNEYDEDGVDLELEKALEEHDDNATESDDANPKKYEQKNEFPQILNTLQQQECFDKDGRLYTRKVVKIEKFWDDNIKSRPAPITEKYVVEKGKARKLSVDEVIENENIIEVHKCVTCNGQFSKLESYKIHTCANLKKVVQYNCSKCSACFANAKSLCAHMKIHREEKEKTSPPSGPYICDECNTDFPSYKSLRLHVRMHDPIKSREIEAPVSYGITGGDEAEKDAMREMFVCEICNKAYDKQYEDAHMNFHKNEDDFGCDICNRKFYTKSNLDMHMRVHSNGKKFTCSYCKKGFLAYENLQEHIANQCQKRRYECQYCGRRFARPHEKVKHERIHTGEKPHICQICGKAFRVSYCLTLHMRTHSGTRPYQCPYCSKRFKAHSVFNHHLLTHSDVRAYKCPYCPKAFKTGVQLAGHKNSHIKPFTCTECNRPFASLYAVRAHMETHKRENNLKFSCWLCGASYARAFALRDHIRDHHDGEQEEIAVNGISGSEALIQLENEHVEMEIDDNDTIETIHSVETIEEVNVINAAE